MNSKKSSRDSSVNQKTSDELELEKLENDLKAKRERLDFEKKKKEIMEEIDQIDQVIETIKPNEKISSSSNRGLVTTDGKNILLFNI